MSDLETKSTSQKLYTYFTKNNSLTGGEIDESWCIITPPEKSRKKENEFAAREILKKEHKLNKLLILNKSHRSLTQ